MPGRIFYLAPDYPEPSGGMAALYEHVVALRQMGFDAFILHDKTGFKLPWLESRAPVVYLQSGSMLLPGDSLVMSEIAADAMRATASAPIHRIIFCQNQFLAADTIAKVGDWHKLNIDSVLASSATVQDYLAQVGWPNAPIIPYFIDATRFRPAAKIRQVAYVPRKMPLEATMIIHRLVTKFPQFADVPFVKLSGMTHTQVAKELARSAIFLSLGRNESMGLPPLEAMACGCLVAGFHGDGDLGLPDATSTARWVLTIDQAVEALAELLCWFDTDDERAHHMRTSAEAFVSKFTRDERDRLLGEFWRSRA
jgi:glycosyltransferase involved in cell wall biosynthesis